MVRYLKVCINRRDIWYSTAHNFDDNQIIGAHALKAFFHKAKFFDRIEAFGAIIFEQKPMTIFMQKVHEFLNLHKRKKTWPLIVNKRYVLKLQLLLCLWLRIRRPVEKYKKRFWIRENYEERCKKGKYYLLVREIMQFDQEYFTNRFWSMPMLVKRDAIPHSEQSALTLRYLISQLTRSSLFFVNLYSA